MKTQELERILEEREAFREAIEAFRAYERIRNAPCPETQTNPGMTVAEAQLALAAWKQQWADRRRQLDEALRRWEEAMGRAVALLDASTEDVG